ncbi:MAG: hypothetical protein IH607_01985 [Firmicutes bacterium]|nr:hypothetical protein [Bacillota bacterium]
MKFRLEAILYGQPIHIISLYHFQNDKMYSFAATIQAADEAALQETETVFDAMIATFALR